MTDKQKRFVDEYLVDLNATQAAIRAGYSENSARDIGFENLRKPDIQEAVKERMHERAYRVKLDAVWVLEGLKRVYERCIQAEPVLDSKGEPTGEYRFDSSGANKALDLIGRHLGMFGPKGTQDDPVHHSHTLDQWHKERDARMERAAALMKGSTFRAKESTVPKPLSAPQEFEGR